MGEQFGAKVPGMPRARLNERAAPLKSGPAGELDPRAENIGAGECPQRAVVVAAAAGRPQ